MIHSHPRKMTALGRGRDLGDRALLGVAGDDGGGALTRGHVAHGPPRAPEVRLRACQGPYRLLLRQRLAVCAATDIPVAKGGVDYRVEEGVSTLWQLAVHPALQSCGIGTFLVDAKELFDLTIGMASRVLPDGHPAHQRLLKQGLARHAVAEVDDS
ncbi:hypothetical protein ABZX75_29045 [Streptomyces sp. NPDC003038]|uniref:hypothetical protein n=1 Tax=unclassified Streptomyces TaxID=2593676 RepID=UPI00339F3A77